MHPEPESPGQSTSFGTPVKDADDVIQSTPSKITINLRLAQSRDTSPTSPSPPQPPTPDQVSIASPHNIRASIEVDADTSIQETPIVISSSKSPQTESEMHPTPDEEDYESSLTAINESIVALEDPVYKFPYWRDPEELEDAIQNVCHELENGKDILCL
jgi:hypothetical protein